MKVNVKRLSMAMEEKAKKLIRVTKIIFFLFSLLFSFLFFSVPVLLALSDTLLSSALFFLSPLSLSSYDFRDSLFDIPLLSFLRSLLIICVYSCCDGPRLSHGPYLWVAAACSVLSLVFVSLKAVFIFGIRRHGGGGGEYVVVVEVALFGCSMAMAVGHMMVAYRSSCREQKKLLVYKIDIEAVSACKKGLHRYEMLLKEGRKKHPRPI